ncbi:Ni,Fe-hydrogenase maturation factor [Halapricum desulfuricans]|uniref:Ni,Fe-hydrogenase maturation factor n=2 Tax=Halapricum desulfuricans TaxID=2841257 RepID=A0A897NNN6_9EURY|nr:Ni,Fe-hydrogenase maturation factor [Halapricum desulfuricans]
MVSGPMSERSHVAVVGVGNPIMGDDGVGERVVEAFRDEDGVVATHAGTTAFFALEAMSGADYAVIVDAVAVEGAEPGAIHRYRYNEGSFDGSPPEVLMHDFSFSEALQAGQDPYDLPDEMLVIGVQPADTGPGTELSDAVAERVPDVIEIVRETIAVRTRTEVER